MKPSIKYQVILNNKDKYSISKMCRFFDVSRSRYYNYLDRKNIPDKDLSLVERISECQEENNRIYGYRRVQIWLKRQGIYKNPKTYYDDNSIVSCKTLKEQSIKLVLDTIKDSKRKGKVTGNLQLNSYQEFQDTSQVYFNLTQSYNIPQSM